MNMNSMIRDILLKKKYRIVTFNNDARIQRSILIEEVRRIGNNFNQLMKSFNHDAHPMGMFISSMAAMSTFHPEANPALHVKSAEIALQSIYTIILGCGFVFEK